MLIDFIVSPAFAEAAPAQQGSPLFSLLPLIFLFAVFYFMLIRPQQKKAKQHKNMIGALKVGDEVVSNGGLLGRILHVDENFLHVEIASDLVVNLQRHCVSSLMPKGTYRGASGGAPRIDRRRPSSRDGQRNSGQNKKTPKRDASNQSSKANFEEGIKRKQSEGSE